MDKIILLDLKPLDDYRLQLYFSTGEQKIFDVSPYISGTWYGKLQDLAYFKQVRIAFNTAQWPDGQDIAPHELYDNSVEYDEKTIA